MILDSKSVEHGSHKVQHGKRRQSRHAAGVANYWHSSWGLHRVLHANNLQAHTELIWEWACEQHRLATKPPLHNVYNHHTAKNLKALNAGA